MTRYSQKAPALTVAVAAMAAGLGGCAQTTKLLSFLHLRHAEQPELAVRPASTLMEEAVAPASAEDRLYVEAKAAIEGRDYAKALELLQVAKQNRPSDGRILNALGVVYDKLGRFDLSRRYYEQALAVQPNSPAVLANMQYSAKLQAYSVQLKDQQPVAVAAVQPAPAFRIVTPSSTIRLAEGPTTLGSAIRIIDASGEMALAKGVQRQLAAKGWSVEAAQPRRVASTSSVIVFKAENQRVAEALAHTLPFSAELRACDAGCSGVSLIVGANARARGRS